MSEIFDIGHESDLSEYTSTVTDGGDLSQAAAAALADSSGGLQCVIDDTTSIYGEKEFTQLTSGEYRFRFYIDPNSLTMADGDSFNVCWIGDSASWRATVSLRYSSGYYIHATVRKDDGDPYSTSNYAITDAEHYVEVLIEYASGESSNDGTLTLWIDGTQKESITDVDLYTRSEPDEARLGAVASLDAGTSGTLYLDEFVFRDDDTEIGQISVPVTVTPSVLATTWATKAPTIRGAATVSPVVVTITWTTKALTIRGAVTVSPSALAVTWALLESIAGNVLHLRQKTLGGIPAVTLTIGLNFPETRSGMFAIPVFQDIKHLDGALQESCAPLGTGHYMNHGWPPSYDGWIATASQKDTELPQIRQIHFCTITDSFALYPVRGRCLTFPRPCGILCTNGIVRDRGARCPDARARRGSR